MLGEIFFRPPGVHLGQIRPPPRRLAVRETTMMTWLRQRWAAEAMFFWGAGTGAAGGSGMVSIRALRAQIAAAAHSLLADTPETGVPEPITVTVADHVAHVTITLTPSGVSTGIQAALSPLEREIVAALGHGPLGGKGIAAR